MTIDAFAAVAERYPDVVLVLVGDGPLRADATKSGGRDHGLANQVVFAGVRRDVPDLLHVADEFRSPRPEACPGRWSRQLLAGLPVAASAVGGIPEVIVDGEVGRLLQPDDLTSASRGSKRPRPDSSMVPFHAWASVLCGGDGRAHDRSVRAGHRRPSMKVLFAIRALEHGGAESQLLLLADGLSRAGHEISVAVILPHGELRGRFADRGVQVHQLSDGGPLAPLVALLRWWALVRRLRPDVVHGYLDAGNILAALVWIIRPRARRVLGVRARTCASTNTPPCSLAGWIEARASRVADRVIANSEAGRTVAIHRGFPPSASWLCPTGYGRRVRPEP